MRDVGLRPVAGVFLTFILRSEAAHMRGIIGALRAGGVGRYRSIVVDMETIRKVLIELRILLFECSRKSASVERFVVARQLFCEGTVRAPPAARH